MQSNQGAVGSILFKVTFEDDAITWHDGLSQAVCAIKERANKEKLVGLERTLFFESTLVEQVAERAGASHSTAVDWLKLQEEAR